MSGAVEIRAMTAEEVGIAVDWAAAEGWNPGLDDARCFMAEDPGGFRMAFVDGEPAASISVVNYGPGFGFLGFYICRPGMRGRGIGYRLWQDGMAHHGDRVVGLDGVVDQQDNYRKSGFDLVYRNIRHTGVPAVEAPVDPRLVPIGPDLVDAVIAYDRPFFPAPRQAFMRCWLAGESRQGWALVEDGRVTGYGVVRRCRSGAKIGPLFADDAAGAELLFRRLSASMPGEVSLDTPEPNAAAVALAERYGLQPVFETARMYRGPAPDLPLPRLFGVTTFELG
ncbi:GNAT family N-acetyltransferase [Thalassobaculum sp.]|uniref:GNAT family N-acetyltransferase n=1 Tax=Thalassobaculum sp. TaxID=2022740 RepID=UPI0032EBE528